MSSPVAMSDSAQMNFNPSWMPPSATVSKTDKANNNRVSINEEDDNTCDPIFAKHSYGREDLLALNKVDPKMPDGMEKCIFSMEKSQIPIILLPLTEIELRLQHNVNSSKAMSALNRQDRDRIQSMNGGPPENSGRGGSDHGGWTVAGAGVHNQIGGRTNSSSFMPIKKQLQQPQTSGQQQSQPALSNRWSALNSSSVGAPVPTRPWKNNNDRSKDRPPTNTTDTERDAITNKKSLTEESTAQVTNLMQSSSLNDQPTDSPTEATPPSSNGHQPQTQQQNQPAPPNNVGITTRASPPASIPIPDKWHYLDPNGVQRGPFDSQQMHAWFSSGYFTNDLRLCRIGDTSFTTLGELVRINGNSTPFVAKAPTPPVQQVEAPSQLANDIQQTSRRTEPAPNPTGAILSTSGISPRLVDVEKIWANNPMAEEAANAALIGNMPFASSSIGGTGSTAFSAFSPYTNQKESEMEKALKEKERLIFEEQVKLREKEEILRREEQEREEKRRQMLEMEIQLQRQKEDYERKARERELELEARRLQITEYERKRKEELEMLEQKIKTEHYQQQLRKEEEERKRARELEELIRREQDRQRQIFEAEVKRKREEEEARLRQAFQEAQRLQAAALESARRAEEEQRHRLMEEQRKQQQAAEEAKRQELIKAEERRRAEAQAQREKAYAATQSAPKVSGWGSIPVQQPSENIWGQPFEDTFTQVSKNKQPSPPIQHSQQPPRTWNSIPATQPAPIPKPPSKQPASQPTKQKGNNKQQSKSKAEPNPQQKKEADKFTQWIIKRVKELNSTVDAEVFASFIEGIESPNEAEDYMIGYLGESKAVKDFHREFLNKRIELRPRVKATEKDDLSGPAAALKDKDALEKTSTSNPAPSGTSSSGNGAAKKKKSKVQKVVLDPRSLGFRPSGDPNRINAGELDTAPPVPEKNNRKR